MRRPLHKEPAFVFAAALVLIAAAIVALDIWVWG